MLQIAVCDDERDVVEKIEFCINSYCNDNAVSFHITKFYDGEELIKGKQKFDLIFLDIEMKKLGGIETAKLIRDFDMNVPIVYITSHRDLWKRAYKVHAFEFILKPFYQSDIYDVMNDFISSKHDMNIRMIVFETKDGLISQNINEICYDL